ncbi:putative carboxylesterase 15 [Glycine max]|nr:putative carboxylesterase 15 [Glycine max]
MEIPQSPFLMLDMLDKFLALALPVGATKDHPFTCPMGMAAPPLKGLKLSPLLLCVAEMDFVRDTEMEYCITLEPQRYHVLITDHQTEGFFSHKGQLTYVTPFNPKAYVVIVLDNK